MSPEEFFMYLTIGLIVVAPLVARLYRWATLKRTTQMLERQFETSEEGSAAVLGAKKSDRDS
jgi:hypothetical protein